MTKPPRKEFRVNLIDAEPITVFADNLQVTGDGSAVFVTWMPQGISPNGETAYEASVSLIQAAGTFESIERIVNNMPLWQQTGTLQ